MNQALRINPNLPITASRKVVDTRNFVIHAYDSLKPDILWGIVVNHMPLLKQEIEALLNGYRQERRGQTGQAAAPPSRPHRRLHPS